jgi:hypothetical protein
MRRIFLLTILLFLCLIFTSWANNKISPISSAGEIVFNLTNDQSLGGVALALKFGNHGEDISCTWSSFEGTRLDYISFKDVVVDNQDKTLLVYAIPLHEDHIFSGSGPLVRLKFSGTLPLKFEQTAIHHQEGISLISSEAKELAFEFDPAPTDVTEEKKSIPVEFALSQNYPNPFNPETQIGYALPTDSYVKLSIYNVLGQKVRTLVDERKGAGYHSVRWDGKDDKGDEVSSGIYFYKIQTDKFNQTNKMLLVK